MPNTLTFLIPRFKPYPNNIRKISADRKVYFVPKGIEKRKGNIRSSSKSKIRKVKPSV